MKKIIKSNSNSAIFDLAKGVGISAFFIFVLLIYFTNIFTEQGREMGSWFAYLFPLLLATMLGLYFLTQHDTSNRNKTPLFWILIGFAFWSAGGLILLLFEMVLAIDPFPSIGDWVFIIGYLPIFIGIILAWKQSKLKISKYSLLFSGLFAAILIFLYIKLLQAYYEPASLYETATSIGYWAGDCLSIIGLVVLFNLALITKDKLAEKTWILAALSLIANGLADITYIIFTNQYEAWNWTYRRLDLFWIISFLLMAYVFYINSRKKSA